LLSPSHNFPANTGKDSDISNNGQKGIQSDINSIKFRLDDKTINTETVNPELKTEKDLKELLTTFEAIKSSIKISEKNQTAVKQETSEVINSEKKSIFNDLVKKVDNSNNQDSSNIKLSKPASNPEELLSPSHNLFKTTVEDKETSKKGEPNTQSNNNSVISPKVINSITNQLSGIKVKAAVEVIELNTPSSNIPKPAEGNDFFVTGKFIQNEIVIGYQSKSLNELVKNSTEKEAAGLNEKPIQTEEKNIPFSFKPNSAADISNKNLLFSTKRIPMLDLLGNNKVVNQEDSLNGKNSQTVAIYRNGETTYLNNSTGKDLFTSITSSLNALSSIDTNSIDVTGSRSIDLNALKNAVTQIVHQPKSTDNSELSTSNEKNDFALKNYINPETIKSDKSITQEQPLKITEKGLEPEAKFYSIKSGNGNDVQPKLTREVSTLKMSESLKDDLKILKETLQIKDAVSDIVKQTSGAREKVIFTKEIHLNPKTLGELPDNLVRKVVSSESDRSERLAGNERVNDINQSFKRFIPTTDESQSNPFVKTGKSGQSQNGFLEAERENTVFRTKETVSIKANDGSIKDEVISSGKKEFVGTAIRNEGGNPEGKNENRERQSSKNIVIKSDQKINTNNILNRSFDAQLNNELKPNHSSIEGNPEQEGGEKFVKESMSDTNPNTSYIGNAKGITNKETNPFHFDTSIKSPEIFTANKGEVKAPFSHQTQIIKSFELIKEMSNFIERRETGTMTFKVEPGNLGSVRISLSVVDDILTAMMEVETQEVKSLVENNMNQLYQNLNQAGIQAAAVKVTLNYNDGKNPKPNSNSKNKNNGKSHNRSEEEELNVKSMGYNTYEYLI
jgi:flagellar hook-length control protein FliK